MTTLVVGATGATGRLLVAELLRRGEKVRAVARSAAALPEAIRRNPDLEVVEASLLDLTDARLRDLTLGCDSIASCLGHTMSFRGVWGPPWRLVTDAVRRLTEAARQNAPEAPVRFVLMNTVGNRNLGEPVSFAQKCALALLRVAVPPHADNEQAAAFLRAGIGPDDPAIEWVAVRPDTLRDADAATAYEAHPSPTRSAIFDAGETSRINVASFMADLITDDDLWREWKGRMPALYNKGAA